MHAIQVILPMGAAAMQAFELRLRCAVLLGTASFAHSRRSSLVYGHCLQHRCHVLLPESSNELHLVHGMCCAHLHNCCMPHTALVHSAQRLLWHEVLTPVLTDALDQLLTLMLAVLRAPTV